MSDAEDIPPLPHQAEFPLDYPDLTPADCGVPSEGARSAPRDGAPTASAAPSLDTKCQNPTTPQDDTSLTDAGLNAQDKNPIPTNEVKRTPWDRKQKRAYHKSITLLKHFAECGHQVYFVTLTGSPTSNAKQLSYHHERLKLSVVRHFGLTGLEHFKVITIEGHGVIHALWAIPPAERGFRDTATFIPQKWLSNEWERIHGARVVDIRRVNMANSSRRCLSRYIVSQYCGGQSGFVRSDYTHPRWLGFSIRSTWASLKREWRSLKFICKLNFGDLCAAWESLIKSRSCWLGKYQFVIWDGEFREV